MRESVPVSDSTPSERCLSSVRDSEALNPERSEPVVRFTSSVTIEIGLLIADRRR